MNLNTKEGDALFYLRCDWRIIRGCAFNKDNPSTNWRVFMQASLRLETKVSNITYFQNQLLGELSEQLLDLVGCIS